MTPPSTNGGGGCRVYCDKREKVAIDGCCDKRGFTVLLLLFRIQTSLRNRNIKRSYKLSLFI